MDSPYTRNILFLAGIRDFDGWSPGRVGSDKTKVKKQVENRLLHFLEDKIVPVADRLLLFLFLSVGRCIFGRLLCLSVGRCAFGGLLSLSTLQDRIAVLNSRNLRELFFEEITWR